MGRLIDADELLKQPIDTANYPSNFVKLAPKIDAIPIPKGATNGDMIKAMFPDLIYHEGMNKERIFDRDLIVGDVFNDWWNAPYKGGVDR